MPDPTITVITNTIRRPLDLVEKSLKASLSDSRVNEVILIDQNEKPLSLSVDLTNHPRLKIQLARVPSVSKARNLANYSQVDWLVFCDDDGYMASDYVQNLFLAIRTHPDASILCGSIKRNDTGDYYSRRHALGGDMSRFWNTKLLMGSNFCVKREVFEKLGKFDENFGAGAHYGSSEETDFAWNAFFHHFKMIYRPELVVFHVPPFAGETWPEVKKAFRYGRGKSALIRKWLFRWRFIVLLEVLEMFLVPWVRIFGFMITLRLKEAVIQLGAFGGRFYGIFA